MSEKNPLSRFTANAATAGAQVVETPTLEAVLDYLADKLEGGLLIPDIPATRLFNLATALRERGCEVIATDLRTNAASATAGLTGANFAIAETGTLVLESTPEDIRLASTLPAKHFVLLNPDKIVADGMEAVPILRRFHQEQPRNYLAYITGPSRTADIERVLTIGVHGPKELHILLCEELSDDPLCQ